MTTAIIEQHTRLKRVGLQTMSIFQAFRRVNVRQRGQRKIVKGSEPLGQKRHGVGRATFSAHRQKFVVFVISFHQAHDTVLAEITIMDHDRFFRRCMVLRIEPHVGDHVVDISISIQIRSCDPMKPTEPFIGTSCWGIILQRAFHVVVDADRTPFVRYQQVQPGVTVHIGKQGAGHQAGAG